MRTGLRNFFTILIFLFFSVLIFSQEVEFITGKLIDAGTEEPIAFATIQLKGQSIGVISNADGSFKIPYKYLNFGNNLVISCLGYDTIEMVISDLSLTEINVLPMSIGILNLQEVIVTGKRKRNYSARRIVSKAIDAISKNYPMDSFSLIGYYRDYQLKASNYLNLNEAILEVFDSGFDEIDRSTTKVRIYEQKVNSDFKIDSLARQGYNYQTGQKIIDRATLQDYGGNEFVILRIHDAIRNYQVDAFDFVNVLKSDLIRNHYFSKKEVIFMDGEPLYTIVFKRVHPNYSALGVLYISQNDFAIHKMKYTIYNSLDLNTTTINDHLTSENLIFEVITEYRKFNDKMFLNYISFQNSFKLRTPPIFMVEEISLDLEEKCLVVKFNSDPNAQDALKKGAYNIKYKGEKLDFKSIDLRGNSVLLYPDMKKIELMEMINSFRTEAENKDRMMELLEVRIENISNYHGDTLNDWTVKDYNQFREFFVQQVNENKLAPKDSLYMINNKPIFKNQTIISQPTDSYNFWMNTPLKNVID